MVDKILSIIIFLGALIGLILILKNRMKEL